MSHYSWILALLMHLSPPGQRAALPALPGWQETEAQRLDRMTEIAAAIETVVYDPAEVPAYGGRHGRDRDAVQLVAIAELESDLAPDADIGPCYRGRDGTSTRCDSGQSATIFQIHVGAGRTPEGWDRADLFGDRKKAVRVAHRLLRWSVKACDRLGQLHALNAYASGTCLQGWEASEARVRLAQKMWAAFPYRAARNQAPVAVAVQAAPFPAAFLATLPVPELPGALLVSETAPPF